MMNAMIWTVLLAAADPVEVRVRLTGISSPERWADFREAAERLKDVRLGAVDEERAEAAFTYEATGPLKGLAPAKVLERLDGMLRKESNSTLGVRALSVLPREQLKKVEIPVGVLDCKACGYAVYRVLAGVDGVEQAGVDLKAGTASAWVDPAKTGREALVEALRKREVPVREK
jgi:copper chaperone CopZ